MIMTPIQELKEHIQQMINNGGDADLLCVIGLIDSEYLEKEVKANKDNFDSGFDRGLKEGARALFY